MWAAFIIVFGIGLALVALEVATRSRLRLTSAKWDIAFAVWYLLLAGVVTALVWTGYDRHWIGLGLATHREVLGREAAIEFFAAFLWTVAFDIDGVFVVSAIFAHLNISPPARRIVLAWSVPISLAIRGIAIALTVWLLALAPWLKFLMAGVLVLAAIRMLLIRNEVIDPQRNLFLRAIHWLLPTKPDGESGAMLRVTSGRLSMTPLAATLVLIASADVYLAFDSVPATFAISTDPVILFAASALALPCLRSLYAALDQVRGWLRWVKVGLAATLAYAAFVVAAPPALHPTTPASLMVIVVSLGSGLALALATGRAARQATNNTSPIGKDAERLARGTLSTSRKIIVFVVGIVLLVVGLLMLIGPGPGLPVTFAALAILGNEFAWARRLMTKYRARAMEATERTAAAARKRFSPWILLPMAGGTLAFFLWLLPLLLPIPLSGALIGAIPTLAGQFAWGYIAFFRKSPPASQPPPSTDATPPPPSR